MKYRFFVNGVERKPEEMTEEEKQERTDRFMETLGCVRATDEELMKAGIISQ